MAKTAEIKIPDDIEYRVISNAFGLLVASAGLLAGEMLRQRSIDYWLNDAVPLCLVLWFSFRLYRNILSTMLVYRDVPVHLPHLAPRPTTIQNEQVIAGQIAAKPVASKPQYSPEKVVEEVAKRIEAQKADAQRKSKSTAERINR